MGLFKTVSDKLREMKQHAQNKKQFFNNVLQAAEDGKLTDEEMDELTRQYKEFGLTDEDLKKVRVTTFIKAYNSTKADGQITDEEYEDLKGIQRFLKIPDEEIEGTKKELRKLRLISEIQRGNLPTLTAPNVILQKAEVAHWKEPASLIEERVISRRYEGGSQGFSFRIAKGVSYRVGGHRGHIVSETGNVPVSRGNLVLTSKRTIFEGDRKSFSLKFDKILNIDVYNDGMKVSVENGKNKLLLFGSRENADVIGAMVSQLINQLQN